MDNPVLVIYYTGFVFYVLWCVAKLCHPHYRAKAREIYEKHDVTYNSANLAAMIIFISLLWPLALIVPAFKERT